MKLIIIILILTLTTSEFPPLKLTSIRGTPLTFDFTKGTATCLKMTLPTLESTRTANSETYGIELSGSLMATFIIDEANYIVMTNYFRKYWRLTPMSDGCLMVNEKYPLFGKRKSSIDRYMSSEKNLNNNLQILIENVTKHLKQNPDVGVNLKDLNEYFKMIIWLVKEQRKEFSQVSVLLYGADESQSFARRIRTLYSNLSGKLSLEKDSNKELLDFVGKVLERLLTKLK
jgi:hypothetical protein